MDYLFGRKLLYEELKGAVKDLANVEKTHSMQRVSTKTIQCLRCGQIHFCKVVQLMNGTFFCPACIQLGRVVSNQFFYHLPEPAVKPRKVKFVWEGQLSSGQQVVSTQLVETVKSRASRLIWAVTGAGKIELLFGMLHYALEQGYRVGVCSPRWMFA